tara:strand:+ start:4048 stop:5400 length:1353 start_codon:yes stop_codon:yes gene_type:complete
MISDLKYSFSQLSISRSLHFILQLTMVCFGLVSLSFNVSGLRLHLYVGVSFFFILGVFFYFLKVKALRRSSISKIESILALIAILFIVDFLSFFGAISTENSLILTQFTKGLFQSFFVTLFLICFLIFNAVNQFKYAENYLFILCSMVFLSCIYQVMYIVFLLNYGINIDDLVWPILSFGSYVPPETLGQIGGKALGFEFVRHGGFAINPNLLVTQLICVIPVVLLLTIWDSRKLVFLLVIFVICMLLTLSRSAFLALAMISILIPIVNWRLFSRYFYRILLFLFVAICTVFIIDNSFDKGFISGMFELSMLRSSGESYFDTSRYHLLLAGIDMFSSSPVLGSGLDSSPVLLLDYPITSVTGPSLHNYWIQLFVEIGVLGIFRVLFYGYMIFECYKINNIYSKAMIVTIFCLLINGMTNNALAHPFMQLFIMCLYCCALRKKLKNSEIRI